LTSHRWQRIEALFAELTAHPPEARLPLLENLEPGDGTLRAEVASLLTCHRPDQPLRDVVRGAAALAFRIEASEGMRLGAYVVIRKLGQGGMGTVYLAVRADDQYQQQVAIKLLSLGMETAESVDRFRRERQILATLEHPYIARLLDGGSARLAGFSYETPYFVMEHVEGEPVNVFCLRHQLDVTGRLRLFLKICEAVSYAHRKLVVHRDLKPSNILVTAEGSPKLLDFGVAKLLKEEELGGHKTIAGLILTPDYASPEQIRGDAMGTATDVYSLGVVLHELLTGVRPRVTASSVDAPSKLLGSVVGTERLRRKLQGDLDKIVQKAMRIEPERRYVSVDQFAEDIHNYLESRPVLARPDSLWYRTIKFARRRRYPLLATAAVALSLICGIVIALSQARHAKDAQARAEERLAQIVGVSNRSLTDVYALLERLPGAIPARKEIVRSTLDLLESLSKEVGGDVRVRTALARAYLKFANLQGGSDAANIGDMPGALKSYRAGAALIGPLTDVRDREGIALWADLQDGIGKVLSATGDRDQATKVLEAAIGVVERSDDTASKAELYLSLSRALGAAEAPRSLEWANRAVSAANIARQRIPDEPRVLLILSAAHTQLGYTNVHMGQPEAAEPHYAESMRIREQLAREHPTDILFRRYLKLAYEHYAALQGNPQWANLGHPEIARMYYKKAQPLEEMDFADDQNHSSRIDYAIFLLKAGMVDVPPDGVTESLASLRRSSAMLESLAAEGTGVDYDRELALAYEYTGHRLLAMGRTAEAVVAYRHTVKLARTILAPSPDDPVLERQVISAEQGIAQALASKANTTKP
jgi:serine/threonine protein kinase